MKKIQFIVVMLLLSFSMTANAANKYEEAMQTAIEKLYQAQSTEDLQQAANTFERIAQKETDKWHPLYYGAYAQIMMSIQAPESAQKDKFLDQAQELVRKAIALDPANSEITAMQGFVYMMRIPIDPASRGPQYSGMSIGALQKAIALDPKNPRAQMFLADMQFGTARFFGSDTTEACETLNKALDLFVSFEPKSSLDPMWGQSWAERNKSQCK